MSILQSCASIPVSRIQAITDTTHTKLHMCGSVCKIRCLTFAIFFQPLALSSSASGKGRQKLGVRHLIPKILPGFSKLDVQKPQNAALLEKARPRCKVWGERDAWEKEFHREKRGQREAKEEKHAQQEERNRKKRWEAKPTQHGDLPEKAKSVIKYINMAGFFS